MARKFPANIEHFDQLYLDLSHDSKKDWPLVDFVVPLGSSNKSVWAAATIDLQPSITAAYFHPGWGYASCYQASAVDGELIVKAGVIKGILNLPVVPQEAARILDPTVVSEVLTVARHEENIISHYNEMANIAMQLAGIQYDL